MDKKLYTVGQAAKLCSISIQTLQYYDRINLIKPSLVDKMNNYRYYSDQDIRYLFIIREMKEIGFSLEEIKVCVLRDKDMDISALLEKKRVEYMDKLNNTAATLNKINQHINNMKSKDRAAETLTEFMKTIELKDIPKRTIASIRYNSSCVHEVLSKRFLELDNLLGNTKLDAADCRIAIYHDFLGNYNPEDCDLEVCVPVAYAPERLPFIRTIPGGLFAVGIYKGPYYGQCSFLVRWISDNGYQIAGPGLEVYLNSFMNTPFPENYITEVQFPVKKS